MAGPFSNPFGGTSISTSNLASSKFEFKDPPITENYTLQSTDKYLYIPVNTPTPINITVPPDTFESGHTIVLEQIGVGYFTIVPGNLTIEITGTLESFGPNTILTLIFKTPNIVTVLGGKGTDLLVLDGGEY